MSTRVGDPGWLSGSQTAKSTNLSALGVDRRWFLVCLARRQVLEDSGAPVGPNVLTPKKLPSPPPKEIDIMCPTPVLRWSNPGRVRRLTNLILNSLGRGAVPGSGAGQSGGSTLCHSMPNFTPQRCVTPGSFAMFRSASSVAPCVGSAPVESRFHGSQVREPDDDVHLQTPARATSLPVPDGAAHLRLRHPAARGGCAGAGLGAQGRV